MAIQNEQMAVAQSLPPHQSPPAKIPVRSKVSSPFSSSLALPSEAYQNESYAPIREIEFVTASETPLSTFSIDVDTASYSNVRRFLEEERTPPADAIRTEELLNYFRYNYPQPSGENAFSVNLEINRAPWNPEHELVRVGLKGREPSAEGRGPANLVFLVDVSGSMNSPDKLPLLQRSLSALVENLSDDDRVAIVTYAGSSGLVLDSTQGKQKREILDAIANLRSGGSTNGSGGIRQAYETARQNFFKGGNNRVILCTDGDFNVGVTDQGGLQKLIETERESGVFLSVLGFGRGNLKDSTMETLADKGNGNYAYIDSISEGRKVLVEQMGSTLFTIAKDVKIQVEFNPARVAGYRLIGYENRQLAKEDFNNDKIDAGEIGAGHTVTALYEIIPAGQKVQGSPTVDPLKYQQPEKKTVTASNEILTVKVRYKAPDGEKSSLLEIPLAAVEIPSPDKASEDFRFATAVAAFGMKLRGSPHVGEMTWAEIQDIARGALGKDPGSYRAEFLTLIEKAKALEKEEK
jgi:Ca-activated chloride channel family protein